MARSQSFAVEAGFPSFAQEWTSQPWHRRGRWPAFWIAVPDIVRAPFAAAYRLTFEISQTFEETVFVAADERYELFLDGERLGRGNERGDADHWFFDAYRLKMEAGTHTICAKVWSIGKEAPLAQMSVRHGFLLCPEHAESLDLLCTGVAPWQAKVLPGYRFIDKLAAWGTGDKIEIDGKSFDWEFAASSAGGWQSAINVEQAVSDGANDLPASHLLLPATLPKMLERRYSKGTARYVGHPDQSATSLIPILATDHLPNEAKMWNRLLTGERLTVPPRSRVRAIIDLEDYLCAYPRLVASGGKDSRVRLHWQEALYEGVSKQPSEEIEGSTFSSKGNRDEIEGKYFATLWHKEDGVGDVFLPDGGDNRIFDSLWWECGRYVEALVETKEDPLIIERLEFIETRYPLEAEFQFKCSDERLNQVMPLAFRALQMCSHETFFDCPYYEQLQYAGDSRLEALVTYVAACDDRLPRKALLCFDWSRLPSGLTQSRYPSNIRQTIPPFTLWWVCMVWDHARWRDDAAFIGELLPGTRCALDHFRGLIDARGLMMPPKGWNFADWVPGWPSGVPPDADFGPSAILNLQLLLALKLAAEIESNYGDAGVGARHEQTAHDLGQAIKNSFWDESEGMIYDDLAKTSVSEHAQSLGVIAGLLGVEEGAGALRCAFQNSATHQATIYFTHYLFEALFKVRQPNSALERMQLWYGLNDLGFKTTVETPEPSRSDCHGWGAHPIYHCLTNILGISPRRFGTRDLSIRPQLGTLDWASGSLPTPGGVVRLELERSGDDVLGTLELPEGSSASLQVGDGSMRKSGTSKFRYKEEIQ